MKNKIVLQANEFTSFTSHYLESLWQEYFDIVTYDTTITYSKNSLFVFGFQYTNNPLLTELANNGYKVVVDNLWEVPDAALDKFYQLSNCNWFWWNESLWWKSFAYDQYVPDKTYKKHALMAIRRTDKIRDRVVEKLDHLLVDMIWSYKDNKLPNDQYIVNNDVDQRFVNPQWVNDTCINLVVETKQLDTLFNLTEKSYKPCAFYQPMLIVGQLDSLKFLKTQGFETFDNIFDESYDAEPIFEKRLDLILENLKRIVKEPYSDLTWEKLRHNHNHFFNEQLCKQRIVTEIIEPLLHYAET